MLPKTMEKLQVINTISINAIPEKVWDVLTNPEQTKKYMFGCETVSEWQPESSLLWSMEYEGQPYVAVKGNIVEIQPGKFLTYTVFDPNTAMADVPENYLNVTYALASQNNQTILTVTQGDYNTVAEGERRYQEAYNKGEGWNPILMQIKEIAEQI
jgi:uncharacterized protein YndB with AHSA1/START domain